MLIAVFQTVRYLPFSQGRSTHFHPRSTFDIGARYQPQTLRLCEFWWLYLANGTCTESVLKQWVVHKKKK